MNPPELECKLSESSLVLASGDQISSDLGQEVIILNLKSNAYYGLNEIGTKIWNLIAKPKSVREIANALVEEYEVEFERCYSDLLTLLQELKTKGLI